MTRRRSLRHLILRYLRSGWQLKARMHKLAQLAVRTETSQIIGAEHTAHVPMPAMRSVPAKTAIVPRTVLDLALRIDVQERTLLVVARIEARVKIALGHLGHVVLVQELALVTLFAEATQPMLAHDGAVAADVPERTGVALFTLEAVASVEELTNGRS